MDSSNFNKHKHNMGAVWIAHLIDYLTNTDKTCLLTN